jgi:hypothetical protein
LHINRVIWCHDAVKSRRAEFIQVLVGVQIRSSLTQDTRLAEPSLKSVWVSTHWQPRLPVHPLFAQLSFSTKIQTNFHKFWSCMWCRDTELRKVLESALPCVWECIRQKRRLCHDSRPACTTQWS